jgi:hypothetical protein
MWVLIEQGRTIAISRDSGDHDEPNVVCANSSACNRDPTAFDYRGILMLQKRNLLVLGGLLTAVAIGLTGSLCVGATRAADGPQVAHMVYFKLKDSSGANRAKLSAACKLLLTGHEGTVSFAVGTLAGDLNGPFNDHDFDVSLHLVFVNKAALDKYHAHARHDKFLEENKDTWEKVRVFDSYLSPTLPGTSSTAIAK